MRALGIAAAAVIGGFVGMLAANLLASALGANESAQEWVTFLGAFVGGIGFAVMVARLLPPAPGRVQRGQRVLADRDQRIVQLRRDR